MQAVPATGAQPVPVVGVEDDEQVDVTVAVVITPGHRAVHPDFNGIEGTSEISDVPLEPTRSPAARAESPGA